jgi:predicted metalloprotease with PDZ domain
VHGREHESQRLLLGALPRRWEVATSMPRAADGRTWQAADYDELVDHPFELGAFERRGFRAAGVDFEVAVTGAWPGFDSARLAADLQRIAAVQVAFWHGRGRPAFERYLFLVHARDEGHGGLEHRASSALLVKRADLPRRAMAAPHDGYLGLLALASHELFHAWSVKRLKPREFAALDYTRENATHLLWFFEGITSYYDELMLLRAGLVDAPRYLRMLEHPVAAVRATPGRHVQSLAQASFDAWTRYYRPDEHTPNTTVSYYAKGALLGLALDLALRTAGRGSLDDVMRLLWRRCERAGLAQDDVEAALREVAGRALPPLREWVHGTADLPLEALLRSVGVTWTDEPAPLAAALGLRLAEGPVSGVQVRHVLAGSAAARAGVAAGDELLAVDGWRVRRFDDARQWIAPGTPFDLLLVRDQRLLTLRVTPAGDAAPGVRLALDARAGAAARRMRMRWLGA